MKLRILSLYSIILLTQSNVFPQWVQTNGPYGSVNATSFFTFDTLNFAVTKCGLFSAENVSSRWNLEKVSDVFTYARKGDSMFIADMYGVLSIIDLAHPEFNSEPFEFAATAINALANSDSCLYAGTNYGGFYKSVGFQEKWEQLIEGLPVDSGYIPPKFGGGKYYHRFVFSIEKNSQYIFAGTQRGIYRADPAVMIWESVNSGLPIAKVSLIRNIGNTIYICIDKIIFKSLDNGELWEAFYNSPSEVTSINEIAGVLYITTKGAGINMSQDIGKNWDPFNNGLDELDVNFIAVTGSVLVCGTYSKGFYYYDQNKWTQNNAGIICSAIRSIVKSGNSLVANDYKEVYISDNGNDWNSVTPSVNMELFGGMAAMGDTVFLSVEYDTSSWPYDQPYIMYTSDKGGSWNYLNQPVPFARDDPYGIYCFKNRLYAYEDEMMYYTDNLGSTWNVMSLPSEFCNYFYDFLVFNSTPFAVACGDGQLVKLNENNEWTLSNSGLPANRSISGMAFCDGALFAYIDNQGFYISRDNGSTWTPTSSEINPGYYITSFVPYGESLFLTGQNGVFYTDNFGQTWYPLNSGLPTKNLGGILILNDTIYLGTSGNGIWKCATNKIPLSTPKVKPADDSVILYPNPVFDFIRISGVNGSNYIAISIFDLSGREILSTEMDSNELNVTELENGTYIVVIKTHERQLSRKIIIIK